MTYANEEQRSDILTSDSGYIQQLTFAGCPSFMRRPFSRELAGIDLAITGIPFDCATTNRPGTRLGPRAIREQSSLQHMMLPMVGRSIHLSRYAWLTTVIASLIMAMLHKCQRLLKNISPHCCPVNSVVSMA